MEGTWFTSQTGPPASGFQVLQVFHHRPFDLHNPQSQEFSRSNLALSSKLRSYAWKEAMGAVRVIVKVTTQCRASWLAEEVFEIWDPRDVRRSSSFRCGVAFAFASVGAWKFLGNLRVSGSCLLVSCCFLAFADGVPSWLPSI